MGFPWVKFLGVVTALWPFSVLSSTKDLGTTVDSVMFCLSEENKLVLVLVFTISRGDVVEETTSIG